MGIYISTAIIFNSIKLPQKDPVMVQNPTHRNISKGYSINTKTDYRMPMVIVASFTISRIQNPFRILMD